MIWGLGRCEFTQPGAVVPGVVGGIARCWPLYAMQHVAGEYRWNLLYDCGHHVRVEATYTVRASPGRRYFARCSAAIFLIRSRLTSGGVSISMAVAGKYHSRHQFFLMRLVLVHQMEAVSVPRKCSPNAESPLWA